ncbi:MAG: hypothetical protein GX117_10290 [Candidatus Hydrogenedentes bacterium]|nr:hypothetical protein [Candidatus Hydrogenedentota bacterium]
MAAASTHNEYHETVQSIVALKLIHGMGNKSVHQFLGLLKGYGLQPAALTKLSAKELRSAIPEMGSQFIDIPEALPSTLAEAASYLEEIQDGSVFPMTIMDEDYPPLLSTHLENNAPPLLFLSGNKELLNHAGGAVVGTRYPSARGIRAAHSAANIIVNAGLVVASGGAVGVDRAAHEQAITKGGSTIVFLPQGIMTYSLSRKWKQAKEEGRLLLVSEYLPYAPWQGYAALARNALIAAQSHFVCVVEPGKKGGSISTTRHALRQGKALLVYPIDALPDALQSHAAPFNTLAQLAADVKAGLIPDAPRQTSLL